MKAAKRIGLGLLTFVVAAGGVALLVVFFASRDSSSVDAVPAVPGREYSDQGHAHLRPGPQPPFLYASNPPTSGPHVPRAIAHDERAIDADQLLEAIELGNVVVLYPGPGAPPAALRALEQDESGPFDRALVDGGQALILARYRGVREITAVAWRHLLSVGSATDPRLRAFADYWLAHGAAG